jgi:glucokinase
VSLLLAGDIGGTNTRLGVFRQDAGRPVLDIARTYRTNAFPGLEAVLLRFCADVTVLPAAIQSAAFGVAGPVLRNCVTLTNADGWHIDGDEVARETGISRIRLVNDLQAMAWGVTALEPGERKTLHAGTPGLEGNAALIAPGTGLGEALLHRVDGRLIPSPSEGGHADFAPRTAREIALLEFITTRFGRASYEHVLSGQGLVTLHRFTHAHHCAVVDPDAPGAPALITAAGLAGTCIACVEVLQMFSELLGAEAGNLALRSVATSGLFVGGGIPAKIGPALQDGRFVRAFLAKPPADDLVAQIPVYVVTHPEPGLLGAAVVAAAMATSPAG